MRAKPILTVAVLAVALLAACGDDDPEVQRACSSGLPDSSAWEGGTFVNASNAAGTVATDEFNVFLADAEPPVSTSPCDAARVFLHLDQRQQEEGTQFQVEAVPGDSADAEVEITLSRLADDSILAERWNFTFEAAEGDGISLAEARRTQSCQPGRGHAAFSPKPCV